MQLLLAIGHFISAHETAFTVAFYAAVRDWKKIHGWLGLRRFIMTGDPEEPARPILTPQDQPKTKIEIPK